jgi:hypothetical protein
MTSISADFKCPVLKDNNLTSAYRMKPCECVVSSYALPWITTSAEVVAEKLYRKEYRCRACNLPTDGAVKDEAIREAAKQHLTDLPFRGASRYLLESNDDSFTLKQTAAYNPIKAILVRKSDGMAVIQMNKARDDVRLFYMNLGVNLIVDGTDLRIPNKDILIQFFALLKQHHSIRDEGEVILRAINGEPPLERPSLFQAPPMHSFVL